MLLSNYSDENCGLSRFSEAECRHQLVLVLPTEKRVKTAAQILGRHTTGPNLRGHFSLALLRNVATFGSLKYFLIADFIMVLFSITLYLFFHSRFCSLIFSYTISILLDIFSFGNSKGDA